MRPERAFAAAGDGSDQRILRPDVWRHPERHITFGVSHSSGDPARHRIFEIRASYTSGGWIARFGEQNLNEQPGPWEPHRTAEGETAVFPTAAACFGETVAAIIATVDREGDDAT